MHRHVWTKTPSLSPGNSRSIQPAIDRSTGGKVSRVAAKSLFHSSGVNLDVEGNRRELRRMQNLVRVSVADTAQNARVGQTLFLSVRFSAVSAARNSARTAGENIDAAGIGRFKCLLAWNTYSDARRLVPASVSTNEPLGKSNAARVVTARQFCATGSPMQPARDHQMEYQPHIVIEAYSNALTDPAQFANPMTLRIGNGRLRRAQQERAGDSNVLERLTDDAFFPGRSNRRRCPAAQA